MQSAVDFSCVAYYTLKRIVSWSQGINLTFHTQMLLDISLFFTQ
jgi:hypothetical protein